MNESMDKNEKEEEIENHTHPHTLTDPRTLTNAQTYNTNLHNIYRRKVVRRQFILP